MTVLTQSRYLQYLPAIFHKTPAANKPAELMLNDFLLPFEQELIHFEDLLAIIDRYFAPALLDTQQAAEFLPWLASWVALTLDEEWDEDKRRRLIIEAVKLYRWRGTVQGLKRYLEIYTGIEPDNIEIRETRWPTGMQIGVASRIGGLQVEQPDLNRVRSVESIKPLARRDYYIVETVADDQLSQLAPGEPLSFYFPTDIVTQVRVTAEVVEIWSTGELSYRRYAPAKIRRVNDLSDNCYLLTLDRPAGVQIRYQGDPLLVEETAAPYRFIVEVQGASTQVARPKLLRALQTLLREDAHDAQLAAAQTQVATVLHEPLESVLYDALVELHNRIVVIGVEGARTQLTEILCRPLTGIEQFVVNWLDPSDNEIRQRLFSVRQALVELLDKDSAPAESWAQLKGLASQVQQLVWKPVTNQGRDQLSTIYERMLAPTPESQNRFRARINELLQMVSATLDQPLTIQEKLSREQERAQEKLRMILDLEKPAHTLYTLKLTPVVVGRSALHRMQIEVRSSIGLDSIIG